MSSKKLRPLNPDDVPLSSDAALEWTKDLVGERDVYIEELEGKVAQLAARNEELEIQARGWKAAWRLRGVTICELNQELRDARKGEG